MSATRRRRSLPDATGTGTGEASANLPCCRCRRRHVLTRTAPCSGTRRRRLRPRSMGPTAPFLFSTRVSDDAAALFLPDAYRGRAPGTRQEAERVSQINILRAAWGCEGLGRPSVNCLVARGSSWLEMLRLASTWSTHTSSDLNTP